MNMTAARATAAAQRLILLVAILLAGGAPAWAAEWLTAPPSDRAALLGCMALYAGPGPGPEQIVAPEVEIVAEVDLGDHVRRTLKYWVEEGERVEGYLLLPKPLPTAAEPRPLVLAPHPTHALGKDSVIGLFPTAPADEAEAQHRGQRTYALELVRRGFVVFAPDRAAYGSRRVTENTTVGTQLMAAYEREFFRPRWPEWRLTSGKTVWDLQRALDFLLEYDFIDRGRVGMIGHSLGGWDTMLLASADERITAAVANGGGGIQFDPKIWTDGEARARALADPVGYGLNLNRMTNVMLMAMAPRPFLYLRATNDTAEHPGMERITDHFTLVADYYRQAAGDQPKSWRAPVGIYYHSNGHSFEAEARALAYTWLEVQLGRRNVGDPVD